MRLSVYKLLNLMLLAIFVTAGCSGIVQGADISSGMETPVSTQVAAETGAVETLAVPDVTAAPSSTPSPTAVPPTPSPTVVPSVRFAVIGDYGDAANPGEAAVAELVKSWDPDFIITVGDNNYPAGEASTIDDNIGQFYHEYIYNYQGEYGQGSDTLRFIPTIGNHDWDTNQGQAYLDYFTLPGNERYYTSTHGAVEIFALNSDSREPDGVGRSSDQGQWLKSALAESTAPWQIVVFHHAPYTSGAQHGPIDWMRWPFEEWGGDAVLTGHEHSYERLQVGNIPYFVNGLGGGAIYDFDKPQRFSITRYNDGYLAMLVEADSDSLFFQTISVSGEVIDAFQVEK